jgi:hypothetical protein
MTEAPTLEAPVEAPAIESLPNATPAEEGFSSAVDRAFGSLENALQDPISDNDSTDAAPVEPGNEETDIGDETPAVETDYDETLPEDQLDTDIDDWTPKAAKRFKQLKEERKQYRSEIDELRQKTVEYEAQLNELSGMESVDELKGKLAEYEQERMFYNLQNTDAYRQVVDTPLRETVSRIEALGQQYGLNVEGIIEIASEANPTEDIRFNPDGTTYIPKDVRLEELVSSAPLRVQAELLNYIQRVDQIFDRQTELYQNVEEALNEAQFLEQEKLKHEASRFAEQRKAVTQNVVGRLEEKLPFLKGIEGLDLSAVEKKVSSTNPESLHLVDQQYNSVVAQVFPALIRDYVSLQKEIDHLTDRLSEYEDAEPGSNNGSNGRSAPFKGSSGVNEGNFIERVSAALGSI